ncbi:uncharacterized protein L201_001559 [Kwoniella dendrophila CBS 6074]|uniref:Uncharacterized protein n=1 Tax=Kwoniella dendrophila CBS 6074 TaxID=1295534 RepID=A0AAX4JPC7_9TREE
MSSSVVLSPQSSVLPPITEPSSNTSRPQRTTRTTINYSERVPESSSTSPDSTTPTRSAAIITRSRRSMSSSLSLADRSPDKRSISSFKNRKQSPLFHDEANVIPREAALGLVLGEEASTEDESPVEAKASLGEEGEDEVDMDDIEDEDFQPTHHQDVEPVNKEPSKLDQNSSHTSTVPASTRITRQRTISPEKKSIDEIAKKNVIRLVFATKRKAEDETEQTDQEDLSGEVVANAELSTKEGPLKSQAILEETKEDTRKRMPRKKRKWLKKGEVDPDDPVAVARQKERHRLIDEAIEDLNKQESLLLSNSHPQLLMLWEELERRKELQLSWLKARNEATIGDLSRLRDHEKATVTSDFIIKREELVNTIVRENRHKAARVLAERITFRRLPNSRPSLRGGRGGGGWPVATTSLLSEGSQKLISVTGDANSPLRRDISRQIQALDYAQAKADLEKLNSVKPKRQHPSSTPPVARSRASSSQQAKQTTQGQRRKSGDSPDLERTFSQSFYPLEVVPTPKTYEGYAPDGTVVVSSHPPIGEKRPSSKEESKSHGKRPGEQSNTQQPKRLPRYEPPPLIVPPKSVIYRNTNPTHGRLPSVSPFLTSSTAKPPPAVQYHPNPQLNGPRPDSRAPYNNKPTYYTPPYGYPSRI